MPQDILIRLEGCGQQNNISIGESVIEIELIVAPIDDIQVKRFGYRIGKTSHETVVRLMVDLQAKLLIFLNDLLADLCYVGHLGLL